VKRAKGVKEPPLLADLISTLEVAGGSDSGNDGGGTADHAEAPVPPTPISKLRKVGKKVWHISSDTNHDKGADNRDSGG
jgi:hypothetical protein